MALKPRFKAQGLRFDSNRSFAWLYRQLGETLPPPKPKLTRVPRPPSPKKKIRYRGPRFCANPVCGNEFLPKRKDQIYCYGGEVDCRAQMARIKREIALGAKFGRDPQAVLQEVIFRLRQRYEGASFRHV